MTYMYPLRISLLLSPTLRSLLFARSPQDREPASLSHDWVPVSLPLNFSVLLLRIGVLNCFRLTVVHHYLPGQSCLRSDLNTGFRCSLYIPASRNKVFVLWFQVCSGKQQQIGKKVHHLFYTRRLQNKNKTNNNKVRLCVLENNRGKQPFISRNLIVRQILYTSRQIRNLVKILTQLKFFFFVWAGLSFRCGFCLSVCLSQLYLLCMNRICLSDYNIFLFVDLVFFT